MLEKEEVKENKLPALAKIENGKPAHRGSPYTQI